MGLFKDKPKFIVIDGIDWSGKHTQASMLYEYLLSKGHKVLYLDYPRYDSDTSSGLKQYLNGDINANPWQASVLFAYDRLVHQLKKGFAQYDYIVSDRYTSSNIIHQGARFKDFDLRKDFQDWLINFEYNELKLLKPTITLIMRVPPRIALENIEKRGNKKDSHETMEHLLKANESLISYQASNTNSWKLIECTEEGKMKTKEDIHKMIKKLV